MFEVGEKVTVIASPSGRFNGKIGTIIATNTRLTGDATLRFDDGSAETFWGEDLTRERYNAESAEVGK